MKFKYPVPNRSVFVYEYAKMYNLKDATARYQLEKMVKAGVLKKEVDQYEEEAAVYNPMRTHNWGTRAEYTPLKVA